MPRCHSALLCVAIDSLTYHWRQRLVRYASARLRRSTTLRRREIKIPMDAAESGRRSPDIAANGTAAAAAAAAAAVGPGGSSSLEAGASAHADVDDSGGVMVSRRLHQALLAALAELPEAQRLQIRKDL